MSKSSRNAHRFDPYKNFKFRIKWDGRYVAGLKRGSALPVTPGVVSHREGGDPSTVRKMPDASKVEPITLEQGVTHDPEFERWASQVNSRDDATAHPKSARRDITIEVFNEYGKAVMSYVLTGCWVSRYQAVPELPANSNEIAIETLELSHEGVRLG